MEAIQSSSNQNVERIDIIDNLQAISSITKATFLLRDLSDLVKDDFTLMTFKKKNLPYPSSLKSSLRTITSQLESCVREDMIPALHQISPCLKESLAILVECLENLNKVDNKTTFAYNESNVMTLSSISKLMSTCIDSFEKVVKSLISVQKLSVELRNNICNTLLGDILMEKLEVQKAQRAQALRNISNDLNSFATTTITPANECCWGFYLFLRSLYVSVLRFCRSVCLWCCSVCLHCSCAYLDCRSACRDCRSACRDCRSVCLHCSCAYLDCRSACLDCRFACLDCRFACLNCCSTKKRALIPPTESTSIMRQSMSNPSAQSASVSYQSREPRPPTENTPFVRQSMPKPSAQSASVSYQSREPRPPTENTPSVLQRSMSDSTIRSALLTYEMRTCPLKNHYYTIVELYNQINVGIKLWTTMISNIQGVDYKSLENAFNMIYNSRKANKAPSDKRKEMILIYSKTISSVQNAVLILADIHELLALLVLDTASKSLISTKKTEINHEIIDPESEVAAIFNDKMKEYDLVNSQYIQLVKGLLDTL